jgi:hypothetical protein
MVDWPLLLEAQGGALEPYQSHIKEVVESVEKGTKEAREDNRLYNLLFLLPFLHLPVLQALIQALLSGRSWPGLFAASPPHRLSLRVKFR